MAADIFSSNNFLILSAKHCTYKTEKKVMLRVLQRGTLSNFFFKSHNVHLLCENIGYNWGIAILIAALC